MNLPEPVMNTDEVLSIIRYERQYQAARWSRPDGNGQRHEFFRTVGEYIVFMQHYLNRAMEECSTEVDNHKALTTIRKIAALAVACGEACGLPYRSGQDLFDMLARNQLVDQQLAREVRPSG
jgi:hypothetical protein